MKSWKNISVLTLSASLLLGSFLFADQSLKKLSNTTSVKSGVGTCFARVTQTFTSLMIRDTSSSYLGQSFMSMTTECFGEAKSILETKIKLNSNNAILALNKLNADVQWFHEKVNRLNNMASSGQISLTPASNIVKKYQDLGSSQSNVGEYLNKEIATIQKNRNISIAIGALGAMLLFSLTLVVIRERRREKSLFALYESEAKLVNDSEIDVDRAMRLIENICVTTGISSCYNVVKKLQRQESKSLTVSPIIIANEEKEDQISTSLFSVIENCISQSPILINAELEKDMSSNISVAHDKELLSQYIKSLISFVEDKVEHSAVEKISMSSKPLGGIAHLKFQLQDYLFNTTELNFFNHSDQLEVSNINLSILKELGDEMGIQISLKNVIGSESGSTQAQIEVILKRIDTKSKVNSVFKGTKKQLLASM